MGRRKKDDPVPGGPECVQLQVRVPEALRKWYRVHAAEIGRPIREVVLEALLDYHDKVEPGSATQEE